MDDVERKSSSAQEENKSTRRSKREKKKSRASDALEKIKLSRETGIRQEEDLDMSVDLFDYVTEEEYSKLVQERQRECWILDDDGTYREHGREIFDEEVSKTPSGSRKPKKPSSSSYKPNKTSGDIKNMLSVMSSGTKRKSNSDTSLKDDFLLNNLMMEIDNSQRSKHTKQAPFTPRNTTPTNASTARVAMPIKGTTPIRHSIAMPLRIIKEENVTKMKQNKEDSIGLKETASEEKSMFNDLNEGVYHDWDMDTEIDNDFEVNIDEKENKVVEKMETEENIQEKRQAVPLEAVSITGWETVKEELISKAPPTSNDHITVDDKSLPLNEDDEGNSFLKFYWLDAYEDMFNQPGIVYLFGKFWIDEVQSHVSCCVKICNIERCIYLLPRDKLLSKSGYSTDQDVTMQDVYSEFNEKFAEKYRIMKFASKKVTRKYAFNLPDIPGESEYLEVRYSSDYQALPIDSSGRSFSKVFGTNTSSLERLILNRQIKGPCWLNIKSPGLPVNKFSWCKMECIAEGLDSVGMSTEQTTPPPLTVLSLSVKTFINSRTRTTEILCVGALVHQNILLDKPPPTSPFQTDFCTIRAPPDRHMPARLEEIMEKKGLKLEITPSERGLLAFFLAKLAKVDPDIIIGHNLSSQWLETLQHRMFACKVPSWSRIGRLKRSTMPKGRSVSYSLCCGRLVCDIKVSAKELIRSRSYDMEELASTILHTSYHAMDNEDIIASFNTVDGVSSLVAHTMDESLLSIKLTHELCVLPLAYQITCIAGNTLNRTLLGGRSERNEYLLLHAFTQRGYIPPDKFDKKSAAAANEEDEEGGTAQRNKSSYAGGLVLEPKVGFYDRLILLLDFNSLYPSIIQEYNICFTTIDHAHFQDDDNIEKLKIPEKSEEQGILPAEIRVLVERRRQVKQLMKGASSSPDLLQQYDIRQKALKLTANSMYGCLGFKNSRFYAKPLAALVTSKGRQILEHTKNLATKLGVDVIYGDTDSIMIDCGTRDLQTAKKIASDVKNEVNKLYRLLEIDIDGIFKCLLLLKKKKYAAISITQSSDGKYIEKREMKGLDIVRRDWCDLAKKTGHFILDQILSGQDVDKLIEKIQNFLKQVSSEVNNGCTNIKDFIITKGLTKLPKDYPDKKSLPHVQVAMRMISRQQHIQPGDVIPYIICQGEDESSPPAQRAFHPIEVAQQQLKIDHKYYLQHQVHAVISRLCEPIGGLDAALLAEWVGLDPASYRRSVPSAQLTSEEIENDDLIKGKLVNGLSVYCTKCSALNKLNKSKVSRYECEACRTPFTEATLMNTLTQAIMYYIGVYYQGWLMCSQCHYRTRSMILQCPNKEHSEQSLFEEYSSTDLHCQLNHFKSIFEDNEVITDMINKRYIDTNAYTCINMAEIFPKLRD